MRAQGRRELTSVEKRPDRSRLRERDHLQPRSCTRLKGSRHRPVGLKDPSPFCCRCSSSAFLSRKKPPPQSGIPLEEISSCRAFSERLRHKFGREDTGIGGEEPDVFNPIALGQIVTQKMNRTFVSGSSEANLSQSLPLLLAATEPSLFHVSIRSAVQQRDWPTVLVLPI